MFQRTLKRDATDQALAAGCDRKAARYAAHRAAYWRDWHLLPEPQAVRYGVRDARIHQHQRDLGAALAIKGSI